MAGKKIYGSKSSEIWNMLKDDSRQRLSSILAEKPLDSLSDDDRVIKGKTVVQRIVTSDSSRRALISEKSFVGGKNFNVKYATINDGDNAMYRWGEFLRSGKKQGEDHLKQYVVQMELKNNIKIPSERKRVASFLNLLESDSEFRRRLHGDLVDAGLVSPFSNDNDLLKDSQKYYEGFQRIMGNKLSISRDAYFNKIREMGYNALVDDNDAGLFGKDPIIFLDSQNDLVIKGVKQVTSAMRFLSAMRIPT